MLTMKWHGDRVAADERPSCDGGKRPLVIMTGPGESTMRELGSSA